jgi:DNA-binding FadR family transcriptional regulator
MMRNKKAASPFDAHRAMSSHDHLVQTLGVEILSGVYRPGDKLPIEIDLLERFGVSRTMLRETIKTLSAKGLLTSKTRVGTVVRDPIHWNFFDAELLSWKIRLGMDKEFRLSLAQIRRAVEGMAAGLAAARRTPEDIVRLRRAVAAMRNPRHTRESFSQADLEFHMAVGAISGNPLIRSAAGVIEAALVAQFFFATPIVSEDVHQHAVDDHAAVVDAIEARNCDAAARAMVMVIDNGFNRAVEPLPAEKGALQQRHA